MIGSHMARRLLEMGSRVNVVDSLLSGSLANINDIRADVHFYQADLRDEAHCFSVASGAEVIFNFAANMGGIAYISQVGAPILRDNALININMLNAAKENSVEKYFFSSSACVYPESLQTVPGVQPLKESDAYPAQPDHFYGWEKVFAEKLCEAYRHDYSMDIKVARFHNVYGTAYTAFDKDKGKAPCHLIIKALKHPNPPLVVWGDGQQTRSFLYIDDCIDAVLNLVESSYDMPVNIGTDELVNIDELAKTVIRISGKDIPLEHDLSAYQGVRGRNADLTLVKQVLGWSPKVKLEDGLRIVYDWAEQHYEDLEGVS